MEKPFAMKVYCRWSEESDLYARGDPTDRPPRYCISVASYRYGYLPGLSQLVHIPRVPLSAERIGLPDDGHSFFCEDIYEFALKLLELKTIGYSVPHAVFGELVKEIKYGELYAAPTGAGGETDGGAN